MGFLHDLFSIALSNHFGQCVVLVGLLTLAYLLRLIGRLAKVAAKVDGEVDLQISRFMRFKFSTGPNRHEKSDDGTRGGSSAKSEELSATSDPYESELFAIHLRAFMMERALNVEILVHYLNRDEEEILKILSGAIKPTESLIRDIQTAFSLKEDDTRKLRKLLRASRSSEKDEG
jgi:hypothetical protein